MPKGGAVDRPRAGDERTIIRTVKDRSHPYTVINNTVFNDARLSWKAKGLMGYFLSKPDDWRISVTDLVARGTDGVKAVYSGLRELVAAGYVRRSPSRDPAGRVFAWEYLVYEVPQVEPLRGNPVVDDTRVDTSSRPLAGFGEVDANRMDASSHPLAGFGKVDESRASTSSRPLAGFLQVGLRQVGNAHLPSTDPDQVLRDNNQPTVPGTVGDTACAREAWEPSPATVAPVREDPEQREPARAGDAEGEGQRRRDVAAAGAPAVPAPCEDAPVSNAPEGPEQPEGGTVPDPIAVCAAYRAVTGQDDLQPEALCAAVRRRPLSPAYVAEKLDLLRRAMETGQVRRPRGFFLAALDRDWTAETAPHPTEALAGGGIAASGEPASATADVGGLVGALHDLGVTASVAERLARHNPCRVRQQLAWLPYRKAKDPAALIVRAVDEGWPEPPAAREARLAEARSREHERWAAEMDRARVESDSPEARRRGREALAEIRAMLAHHRDGAAAPAATTPGEAIG